MSAWNFDGLDDGTWPENELMEEFDFDAFLLAREETVEEQRDRQQRSQPSHIEPLISERHRQFSLSTAAAPPPPPNNPDSETLPVTSPSTTSFTTRHEPSSRPLLPHTRSVHQHSQASGHGPRNTDIDRGGFVTLDVSSDSDANSDDMPSASRRRSRGANRRSAFVDVDLTSDMQSTASSPPSRPTRKRSADDTAAGPGPASKRSRRDVREENVDELDLTNEAPSVEEELLQAQQKEAIRAQQAAEDAEPRRIGKKSCIVCMENFTDCTVTACGHFYCHECLVRSLMASAKNSDRNIGTCPVCRKPLSHTAKKKNDIIPISFMTKKEFDKRQNRRLELGALG